LLTGRKAATEMSDFAAAKDLYWIYRSYIQHEDDLINNRTTWLITIQSFLLATFGFSYQKWLEVFTRYVENKTSNHLFFSFLLDKPTADTERYTLFMNMAFTNYGLFLLALCAIGFAVGGISFYSIKAAALAIEQLTDTWADIEKKIGPDCHFPKIIGGGSKEAAKHGLRFPTFLPRFFMALWAVTVIAVIYSQYVSPFLKNVSFLPY
jgi:hypothetical protein